MEIKKEYLSVVQHFFDGMPDFIHTRQRLGGSSTTQKEVSFQYKKRAEGGPRLRVSDRSQSEAGSA